MFFGLGAYRLFVHFQRESPVIYVHVKNRRVIAIANIILIKCMEQLENALACGRPAVSRQPLHRFHFCPDLFLFRFCQIECATGA